MQATWNFPDNDVVLCSVQQIKEMLPMLAEYEDALVEDIFFKAHNLDDGTTVYEHIYEIEDAKTYIEILEDGRLHVNTNGDIRIHDAKAVVLDEHGIYSWMDNPIADVYFKLLNVKQLLEDFDILA